MEISPKNYWQMTKIINKANQANGAMKTAISLMDWKGKQGFEAVQQDLAKEINAWDNLNEPKEKNNGQIANKDEPSVITISDGAEELVRIMPDGTLIYGKNYTPDKVAKIFWEAMAKHMPAEKRNG